jgi:signal transduction histidine kinase
MLKDIQASSERLLEIVRDFLEVSRLEQGKIEIRNETFGVEAVIEKVVNTLHEVAHAKKLAVVFEKPVAALPHVVADPSRVEQVLTNLIGNALKFTEQGTVTITVQTSGTTLKVSIADTGTGISPHNQTLLFRKFQQAGEDVLARNDSQSTGLGLYISKLILSAMGGTIALEKSVPGEGSTFSFTLPVAPLA